MSLSRPIYNLLGAYLEQLYYHPIRTKSITSCVIASSANYASQKIAGAKKVNRDSLLAYGLFGLVFGGTIPHYFYSAIDRLLRKDIAFRKFITFFIERIVYMPFSQALCLYFLSRFEGHGHNYALANLQKLYWPILEANWMYLSLPMFLNIYFVPPLLRVLVLNIIGFIWVIFVATKQRKAQSEPKPKPSTSASNSNA